MRYLLVGLGNIGQKRRPILGERCVATVDPFNPAADFRSPQDCPADAYDAALLAVPNDAKLDLVEYFLSRRKHVVVEKPLLFPDRATAEQLDRLARENGVVWYTSYNHRFEPLVVSLKQHLDSGALGRLYHGRLFYGNGTVANVVGTWRDAGLGVLEDLGSHLLDLSDFLLGYGGSRFETVALNCHEAKAYDHAVLASADRRLTLEMSYLCWKNTFGVELFGENGSLHLHGLRKWGPSELVVRERVRPSGVPRERRETSAGPDCTWEGDLAHFERLTATGCTSLESDWWLSRTLSELAS